LANLKSVQEIVRKIEQDLEEDVIGIIRSIIASEQVDLNTLDQGALVNTIMIRLGPVVQDSVNVALTTTKYRELVSKSDEIINGINIILRPFVTRALSQEVEQALEAQRQEAARLEAARLEAARREAERQEAARREAARLEALRQEAARQEAARLEAERLKAERADLIQRIIARLEPIVTRVIKTAVSQEQGEYDTNTLTETIIDGLQPVVLGEVTGAISTTRSSLDAQDMTSEILRRLRPFIVEGVEAEIEAYLRENSLVSSVVTSLQPHITDSVNKALVAKIDGEKKEKISASFLAKIRPAIRAAVIRILKTTGLGVQDEDALIELVMGQFKEGYLLGLITEEVRDVLGENIEVAKSELELLLEELRPQIRSIVIQEITGYRQNSELSLEDQNKVIQGILVYFQSAAKRATTEYLTSGKGRGQSEDAVASAVIASLQSQIVAQLEQAVGQLKIVRSGYATSQEIISQLMPKIMSQMRVFIIKQVQLWRAEQARLAAQATPAPSTKIVSIFGDGKGNSVNVDTPNYQFNYAFD